MFVKDIATDTIQDGDKEKKEKQTKVTLFTGAYKNNPMSLQRKPRKSHKISTIPLHKCFATVLCPSHFFIPFVVRLFHFLVKIKWPKFLTAAVYYGNSVDRKTSRINPLRSTSLVLQSRRHYRL